MSSRTKDKRRYFGSIRKLPSGRHQARYRGPDDQPYAAPYTFDTATDADTWLTVVHADIIRGVWTPPTAAEPEADTTFGAYADEWIATRTLAPNTRTHYTRRLLPHLLEAFGPAELADITPGRVRSWYRGFKTDTPTYRAQVYSLLRTILKGAVDDRLIDHNPCTIRGAGSSKRKRRIEPASLPELAEIVEAMPDRLRLMVLLAAWCACRFEELAELRRKDINPKAGTLRVERAVVIIDGERIVGPPKSEAGERTVSIPPHLMRFVEDHLRDHAQPGREGLLFPSKHGVQMAHGSLYWHYNTAREQAGRKDLNFHALRHTGAVLAAATGATIAELMARLGHSTPAMAMRYQHAAQDRDRTIAEALSKLADAG